MNKNSHTLIVNSFSTVFDICSILALQEDITFTVNTQFVGGKFDRGYIEYEIVYSYKEGNNL